MKRRSVMAVVVALVVTAVASGHDLFMKADSYFVAPNTRASMRLLNGTFQKSDGLVARDRFRDISLIAPNFSGPIIQLVSWKDEGKTTVMSVKTGEPGTYVAAVSTKPREIDLKASVQ